MRLLHIFLLVWNNNHRATDIIFDVFQKWSLIVFVGKNVKQNDVSSFTTQPRLDYYGVFIYFHENNAFDKGIRNYKVSDYTFWWVEKWKVIWWTTFLAQSTENGILNMIWQSFWHIIRTSYTHVHFCSMDFNSIMFQNIWILNQSTFNFRLIYCHFNFKVKKQYSCLLHSMYSFEIQHCRTDTHVCWRQVWKKTVCLCVILFCKGKNRYLTFILY